MLEDRRVRSDNSAVSAKYERDLESFHKKLEDNGITEDEFNEYDSLDELDSVIVNCAVMGITDIQKIYAMTPYEYSLLTYGYKLNLENEKKRQYRYIFIQERLVSAVDKDNKYIFEDFDSYYSKLEGEKYNSLDQKISEITAEKQREFLKLKRELQLKNK